MERDSNVAWFVDFKDDMLLMSNAGDLVIQSESDDKIRNPIIYVKERKSLINSFILNKGLRIEMKIRKVNVCEINPIILMIRINQSDELIYGQWLNLLNREDAMNLIDINYMKYICIRFIDTNNNLINQITIPNNFYNKVKDLIIPCIYDAKWTYRKFESAVVYVNSTVKSKADLFHTRRRVYKKK